MNRRHFLASAALAALAPALSLRAASEGKFFTLAQRKGRWWLIKPDGVPFFSLGLNHIDPASLRYPENIHLWRDKYGGSTVRWLQESVAPNLQAWGFNTVGWIQDTTVRQWKHSRAFTHDEYRAVGLPCCHLRPLTESHQWDKHTAHDDFRSAELAADPHLIGYFYSDCPCWIHQRPDNAWRGPMFDPERLKTEAGRTEPSELARIYYQTTHDAVRRHDPHHLPLAAQKLSSL